MGMMCKLCQKHDKLARNGTGVWCKIPCYTTRRDKIVRHSKSCIHGMAIEADVEHRAGGIQQAFQDVVSLEMKAVIGCCKCVLFLCKQEIAHTTTYPQLLALAESLGCDYFRALNVGKNAKYTSPQIVAEFLEALNAHVEEKVVMGVKQSTYFSLMVDESTDISILKHLVLYGRFISNDTLRTSFLKTVDLLDGRATTIADAITSYIGSVDLS